MKILLMDGCAEHGIRVDHDFIAEHTQGFARFAADFAAIRWEAIEKECVLT
jgi:hypothetical protein